MSLWPFLFLPDFMESTFRKREIYGFYRASRIPMINIITFTSVHEHWCLLIFIFFRDHFNKHSTSIELETVVYNENTSLGGILIYKYGVHMRILEVVKFCWPTNECLLHEALNANFQACLVHDVAHTTKDDWTLWWALITSRNNWLSPSSLNDLLQASKKTWEHCSFPNENELQWHLHLSILEH